MGKLRKLLHFLNQRETHVAQKLARRVHTAKEKAQQAIKEARQDQLRTYEALAGPHLKVMLESPADSASFLL